MCFAVIAVAIYTVVGCLMHINDDHSVEAVLGSEAQVETFTAPALEEGNGTTGQEPAGEGTVEDAAQVVPESAFETPEAMELPTVDESQEAPSVTLTPDSKATANNPTVTVTAAFGDIMNSISADLTWTVDGEVVYEEADRLLVEGSTVSYDVTVDVEAEGEDNVSVVLDVSYADKSFSVEASFPVERPDEDTVVIQTAEIPVRAMEDTDVYEDKNLQETADGQMAEDETGLMLEFAANESGIKVLRIQLEDGSKIWVDAEQMEISQEDCTTDEDYSEEAKVEFVNSMGYDSPTEMLVWVSLYTQKVNVFEGYLGNWKLTKSFDCASGKNESPTTTGTYYYYSKTDRWDLGETYCEPVLVYNGGEAFTSQPYDTETGKVADDTIGKPASGGAIRMTEEDIAWLEENLQMNSMVVVY